MARKKDKPSPDKDAPAPESTPAPENAPAPEEAAPVASEATEAPLSPETLPPAFSTSRKSEKEKKSFGMGPMLLLLAVLFIGGTGAGVFSGAGASMSGDGLSSLLAKGPLWV